MAEKKFMFAEDLANDIANDEKLQKQIQDDPKNALRDRVKSPLQSDNWIYRIVVIVLGLGILSTIVAAAVLAGCGKTLPDGIIAIGSAAVGAMTGLLAPSPARG